MTKSELIKMLEDVSDDTEITVCPVPNVINWTNHIQKTVGRDDQGNIVLALSEQTVHYDEPEIEWKDPK